MFRILSHETQKQTVVLKKGHELVDFVLQIALPEGDSAHVEGGTELLVSFDNKDKEINSYAFVPKNNPSRPTISVSLKEGEWKMVRSYCEQVLTKQ